MFRSRKTGRITLAQFPNWSLALWFIASAVLTLGQPRGLARGALVVLAAGALMVWAADEVWRGVNPFRRILGAIVLAWVVRSLATRSWSP